MLPFDYVKPKSHREAGALLGETNGARAMLGGTDLIVRARAGVLSPSCVVDLKGLPGITEVRPSSDGGLIIGAGCTMNQVAQHPAVRRDYAILAQACAAVASYQLRNRATIGGNCCNASPAADTAPPLFCLAATAEIYGRDGVRCLPIAEFFVGPGRTALAPGEFLTALWLPPPSAGSAGAFQKLGRTRAGDIAIVNVAVYRAAAAGWRITLGAVGTTPLRAPAAEAALAADCSPAGIAAAAALAAAAARPIDDVRAGAAYRRAMVRVLTQRAIASVLAVPAAARPAAGGAR